MNSLIRKLRQQRNWSQNDLAVRIGVSQVTICKWEQRECQKIKLEKIRKLAEVFGVPLSLFLPYSEAWQTVQEPTHHVYRTKHESGVEVVVKSPHELPYHERTLQEVLSVIWNHPYGRSPLY